MYCWQKVKVKEESFQLKVAKDFESHCLDRPDWPVFSQVWPSSIALAEYLSELGVSGLRMLELGCGLGLPSLVAATRGAKVVSSDFHPLVGPTLSEELRVNAISGVRYLEIDWQYPPNDIGFYDLICASDVLYEPHLYKSLVNLIVKALKPGGRVLVADPGRYRASEFFDVLSEMGLPIVEARKSNEGSVFEAINLTNNSTA